MTAAISTAAVAGAGALWWRQRKEKAEQPLVLCQASPENLATVRHLSDHLQPVLWPSWFTANAHVATGVGFTRLTPRFEYSERQEILLDDGGTVALDWLHAGADARAPVLVLIHGLNGSSDDAYIRWMADLARRPGPAGGRPAWRVAAYVMRGCGSLPLTSTRGYSAADPEDLGAALHAVKARYAEAPIVAAGFSLGGNLLVKYLARAGASTPLVAAASISNPFALRLDGGVHKPGLTAALYSRLLAFKLKSYFKEHMRVLQLKGPWVAPAVSSCATVEDIDTIVVPRLLNLENRQAYYEAKASSTSVGQVGVPLLVLHARDDPLIDSDALPVENCLRNSGIIVVQTKWGGHIGWGTSFSPFSSASWAEFLVLDYLDIKVRAHGQEQRWNGGRKPVQPHFPIFQAGGREEPQRSRL